ncbi:MAG: hypothetical protein QMD86_02750 [Patescibacteria group bacterium]|nr:hypothetical protein [Patescibacteria group bacterium]
MPVIYNALKAIKNRQITVDLLAGIALIISLIYKEWISVIFINLMITSARIFSDYTTSKSRKAIERLMKLKPQKVRVSRNGKIEEITLEQVEKDDLVIMELGERAPVDGIVEKGEAILDKSSLTGESMLVFKRKGDKVLSSTIVVSGNLEIRADKVGKETTFEKNN